MWPRSIDLFWVVPAAISSHFPMEHLRSEAGAIALTKVRDRMTVDEFLNWNSEDAFTYELVDGEPATDGAGQPNARDAA